MNDNPEMRWNNTKNNWNMLLKIHIVYKKNKWPCDLLLSSLMSTAPAGRYAVVVLQGGLGNQLFQFCAGETIHYRTGYPVLYDCDLTFQADPFGRQFELARLIPPERRARAHSGGGAWRSTFLERIECAVERHIMWRLGIGALPLSAILPLVNWWPASEVACRGYFQSLDYVNSETAEQIRRTMNLPLENLSSDVAVHFRLARNRYVTGAEAPEHSETLLGLDYYRESVRQIRSHLGAIRFRIFSDLNVVPEGVFQPGDDVVLDRPLQDETSWDALARMANCRHFILGNSTFSWWAAFLSRAEDKRTYAPKDWLFMNGAPSQRGIFPKSWHRV